MSYVPLVYLPLSECVKGRVYKILSRNLSVGVFNGDRGFIGIRQKFNSRYLFTEYHWDSPPYATVRPISYLSIDVPDNIQLLTDLGTEDQITKRAVNFDKPVAEGGRGWYYEDTNEADQNIRPISVFNYDLFNFLDEIQKKHTNG